MGTLGALWGARKWIGGGLLVLVIAVAAWWAKGRFDRADEADRVEAQAKLDVAAADARATAYRRRAEAEVLKAQKAAEDRIAVDAAISKREDDNATLIRSLKARIAAASARDRACDYGPDALRVLEDAWGIRAGSAGPAVREPAGPSGAPAPAPGSAARPLY